VELIGTLVAVAVEHAPAALLALAETAVELLALQEEELLALLLQTLVAVAAVQV
jgi:hypothetical protein